MTQIISAWFHRVYHIEKGCKILLELLMFLIERYIGGLNVIKYLFKDTKPSAQLKQKQKQNKNSQNILI